MKYKNLNKNLYVIIVSDIVLLIVALIAAYMIRFDFIIPKRYLPMLAVLLPQVLIIKIAIFYYFGLYRGMWRYTSIADLFNIIKASSLSFLIIISTILLSTRFIGASRSIFIIDWCLTILFISFFRLSIRIFIVHMEGTRSIISNVRTVWSLMIRRHSDQKNLLIIGAGDCGEKIYREIRDNLKLKYNVIGFLDDDQEKKGKEIHCVPILGTTDNAKYIAEKIGADEILIAISSASPGQMRTIIENCKKSGIPFKTIPGLGEIIGGKVTVNSIREVDYRDLLGRDVVNLDLKMIGSYIKGQTVMVTGAGGSIGSELCRQICRFAPKKLLLYERAESPLFYIDLEIKKNFKEVKIIPLLSDIQEREQLEDSFKRYGPDVIFHAAAYKHVPMLETQPWRAVENNIYGTLNLIKTAKKYKAKRIVFVSTDKAVRPANVMGASKRIAEMLVHGLHEYDSTGQRFMIVRFGNVVGSVGSVVPLFMEQIKNGGPVTVTHPKVTRYFMTIPEACQLILQAGSMGSKECVETYILEMGRSIRIVDMARDLIRFSGFEPDTDIRIEFIGLRPGEKLYEELITEGEGIVPTKYKKIMVLRDKKRPEKFLYNEVEQLIELSKLQDGKRIKRIMKEIIPEYQLQ